MELLSQYSAIFAIISLGVGFFSGLRITRDAMVNTGDDYLREYKLFDIRLISTYGFTDEEIAKSIELVLIHNSNVSTKQIAKDASRNFGFKSTSKKTASRINGVLDLMIANNRVKIVDDYVELN